MNDQGNIGRTPEWRELSNLPQSDCPECGAPAGYPAAGPCKAHDEQFQYTEERAHGPLAIGLAVTDDMVERAVKSWITAPGDLVHERMRAALEAALSSASVRSTG